MNHSKADSKRNNGTSADASALPKLLSATTITGDEVRNLKDEKLGTIHDIMLDIPTGKIRYAVLSSGGFLGIGDRLFAVPWSAFTLDREHKRFVLNVEVERLKAAPGFDRDAWPDMADSIWNSTIESYYGTHPGSPGI